MTEVNFLLYPRVAEDGSFPSQVNRAIRDSDEFGPEVGFFNPLKYGLKLDGITDGSGAINDALEDADAHGGGYIVLPPGPIRLSAPIGRTSSYLRHVKIIGAAPRGVRWNFGDGALDPEGKPWVAGTHLRVDGNFPVLHGLWENCTISNMALDADMRGSAAVRAHFSKTRFSDNELLGWSGFGALLNNGELTDDLGYLNHFEYNNISDTGEEVGVGLQLEYRFIDSWINNNNIEAYGPDIQINSGGPFRILDNHLNGNRSPIHNILINGGVRECLIRGNILEGSREEAIKYTAPGWLTSPEKASISVTANIVRQSAQSGNKPIFGFYGATANAGFYGQGLTLVGNVINTDYAPTHVLEVTKFQDVCAVGNSWRTGHASNKAPVRALNCTGVEVIGNHGDNTIVTV